MESYSSFNPRMMQGKVVLITGGSRGGMLMEIAKAYLLHQAKAVVLMSRSDEKLNKVVEELNKSVAGKSDGVCQGEAGDVRKPEDCK
mmetsp:Transcript_24237/g.18442  ORF Transcript_24237/g.18442 Transcript_24237/m.18442 type:complete len:87 (-) Transcript_24237:708-968(-)